MRNFWVEVLIDGRRTTLRGGPKASNGGMAARFYVRGDNTACLTVACHATPTALVLHAHYAGARVFRKEFPLPLPREIPRHPTKSPGRKEVRKDEDRDSCPEVEGVR